MKLLKLLLGKFKLFSEKIFALSTWLYLYFIIPSAIISAFVETQKQIILRPFTVGTLTSCFPSDQIYSLENK